MAIKLIAADLDGTLLSSERRFSDDLFPLIGALHARGVRFAPASGRQYFNLREMFAPIADELVYISENGAMVCDGERLLSFAAMPADEVARVVGLARTLPGVSVILAGEQGALYENQQDGVFLENMAYYYARRRYVPDLMEAAHSLPVCKIALFCSRKAETVILPAFRKFEKTSQVALSGADWVDLMRPGMNKGEAIGALCRSMCITPDECMAFGDYLNDVELLRAVGESYAMDNAHPDLKRIAKHVCPSNDDDGVCRTIRRVLGIDK
ncbi:Cof-type HAD-IIB family hydrolase [Agathobaculum sp.]|uniref:Cof-type HAD-IIB family hydrolase n=1 Tax=Agathobaculum sp. TaxID=2048138 RepID=UPI002A7EB0E5|nr:Cof-type HAD-IIB family hydrolase [Agathobaculum sp.]MDY3617446.1 Cof-type HAD-IIB family hydrolase [Agathobaculum sp.]